jgi:flavin reductase (DIM6/NTAB) family NADH-FMN oxidoreductase RutF
MTARPTAPSEFDIPLSGTAVWAGPDGLGDSSFDDVPEEQTVELPAELGDDPRIALRRTLGMFATGVTVITTREGDQAHGMTANAFMSVSLEPPLVLISVDRRTKMCALLYGGRNFGVSVLADGQAELSDRFAGRAALNAREPRFEVVRDTPLVEGALAHFVANIVRSYWGGDHSLFLGLVQYARYSEGTPLLFHGGRYERLGPVET